MNIIQSYLTNNPCYTAGRTITVEGLMLHSVGTPQPSASVFINNWNKESYTSACVHAFIDGNTGDVYQTLPWNRRGWHCGSGSAGSGNNTHIGVEMCEPACIKYTSGANFTCSDTATAKAVVKRTYESAVELFASLCKQYNLDPTKSGVILSHSEGYKKGIASNHADPEHLWKGLGLSYTMDTFRDDVKSVMNGGKISTSSTSSASTTTSSTSNTSTTTTSSSSNTSSVTNTSFPTCPFTVQVKVSDLNIRKTASMSGAVVGQTGKGTFTITKMSGSWGYLKSGLGYIYLGNSDYVTIGKTVTTTTTESKTTTTSTSNTVKYTKGKTYTLQVDNLTVRKGAGTNYSKITYSNLTANAKKHAYASGCLKKGTAVTCKDTDTDSSGNIWMQIPSGWIAAYYNKQYYVK